MNMLKILTIFASAVCFGLIAPAQATIIQGSFSGTVTQGYGTGDGVALATLVGKTISGVFTFDTNAINNGPLGDGVNNQVFLGSAVAPSMAFYISQTIDGHIFNFLGTWNSRIDFNQGSWGQAVSLLALGFDHSMTWIGSQNDLIAPYFSNLNDVTSIGVNDPIAHNYGSNFASLDSSGQNQYYFSLTSFSAGPATSVPEPSTLALLGLGLAGIAFARRRKV